MSQFLTRDEVDLLIKTLEAVVLRQTQKLQPSQIMPLLRKLKFTEDLRRTVLTQDELDRLWKQIGLIIGGTKGQFDTAVQRAGITAIRDQSGQPETELELLEEDLEKHADAVIETIVSGEIRTPYDLTIRVREVADRSYYVTNREQSFKTAGMVTSQLSSIAVLELSERVKAWASGGIYCWLLAKLLEPDRIDKLTPDMRTYVSQTLESCRQTET
jgi:hypothetical protein